MTKDVRQLILGRIQEIINHQPHFESSDYCETFYDPRDGSVELKVWNDNTCSVNFRKADDSFVEKDFTTFEDARHAFELAWNVRNELRETLGKFFK